MRVLRRRQSAAGEQSRRCDEVRTVLGDRKPGAPAPDARTGRHTARRRQTQSSPWRCGYWWKREDIERPSRGGPVFQVGHGADEAERRGLVARVEVAADDGARPAADAGQDGDVFVPVRPAIGDRLADDAGAGLELPFQFAAARIDRLEPAVHGSVEDQVAGGGQGAAPERQVFLDLPGGLLLAPDPRR